MRSNPGKDWGPKPTIQQMTDMLNVIPSLEADLEKAALELRRANAEENRIRGLLNNAKNELGRMLKASDMLNSGCDYRVVHRDEANNADAIFGMHRVSG